MDAGSQVEGTLQEEFPMEDVEGVDIFNTLT